MEQEVFLRKFSWDGEEGREELLIRAMLYANPLEIAPLFRKEELRRVFLNNLHRFTGKDRSFWKLVLDVSEEEMLTAMEGKAKAQERPTWKGCS